MTSNDNILYFVVHNTLGYTPNYSILITKQRMKMKNNIVG